MDETTRILVVDDNPINQEVMLEMLELLGHRANVASDGREALRAFEIGPPPDLVLMDLQMPHLSGLETTRLIRRWARDGSGAGATEHHPVIVGVTANAMPGTSEECLEAGMDDTLSKPFSLEQLGQVIARWLAGRYAARKEPV